MGAGECAAVCGRGGNRLEANRARFFFQVFEFGLLSLSIRRPPLFGRHAELLVPSGFLLPVQYLAGFAAVED